ncbi:MAG: hypothetical protein HYW26_02300 [Candidatus Aenigmarchaeota archaeon]|nr:hypothetical protein [Candidatus Aenigmarchaeota archaeon]
MSYLGILARKVFTPRAYGRLIDQSRREITGLRTPQQFNDYRGTLLQEFGGWMSEFNRFDLGENVPPKVRSQYFYSLAQTFSLEAFHGGHPENLAKAAKAYQMAGRHHREDARQKWKEFFDKAVRGEGLFSLGFSEYDVRKYLEGCNLPRRDKERYKAEFEGFLKEREEKNKERERRLKSRRN